MGMGILKNILLSSPSTYNERAIWGYQDFLAGAITTTNVTLNTNSNGVSAIFDSAKLINSSAALFRQDGISYAFTGTTSLFSSKITVVSQVGATITLNGIPNASWGTLRIWFQILSTTYPQDYTNPPLTVQSTVVTELGTIFEEEENKVTDFTVVNNILYPSALAVSTALDLKQTIAAKDTNNGYAGLTLFKINFKNAANTFTSFFTNANTAARTYTFQNRDGTILDSTDLSTLNTSIATKQSTNEKDTTGGYAGLTLFKINFKNVANTFTSFFTNSNTAARTYTFQDRNGTILDNTDLSTMIALVVGKQDSSLNLTSLASLTLPTDGLLYSSGAHAITTTTLTAAARTVLDDLTVDAMVDTLGGAASTGSGGLARINSPTLITPALGTPSALVGTNITGTATGLSIGGNAATATTANTVTTNANLTGDVTSVGNSTTLTNAPVIAKVLTGYVSGAGVVDATDSILSAIQKLNGNDATNANLTGAVTSVGNEASLGSFTSAELLTALSTKTGTGNSVFATSPTLITPALGTPASGNLGNCVGYASVNLPTGTCLKVVSTTKNDTASTTSSTYAAITGLSATITPVNSSSDILVQVVLNVGGANLTKGNFQLFRGTTQIAGGSAPGVRISDSAVFVSAGATSINSVVIQFLDSPATGSAVVYSVKWSSPDNVSTVYLNRASTDTSSALVSRTISTITLQEFKG